MTKYASRAGEKLEHALTQFKIDPKGLVCADFGSSTGGFVDCLIKHRAKRVYSVDTAYGELDWNLRNNPDVIVIERTNAMHVALPERAELITIDVGWTQQAKILPNAINNLAEDGKIISLVKPHYEAPKEYLKKGKLQEDKIDEVMNKVKADIEAIGLKIVGLTESPIVGDKGGNKEFLAFLSQ